MVYCEESQTYYTEYGLLNSPNYPENYQHMTSCDWVIDIREGVTIVLTFTSMDLEDDVMCRLDNVEVCLEA